MEKNIFEGPKFGDKFLTRDGRVVLFIGSAIFDRTFYSLIDEKHCIINVDKDGHFLEDINIESKDDIVSKYQEPIDEEKLENKYYIRNILKFAEQFDKENYGTRISGHFDSDKEYLEMKINYIQKTIEKG